jgi:hypothetical protein
VTTGPILGPVVSGEALADFRQRLSGAYAIDLLTQAQGRLLVQLAVGVGKTAWLIDIIRHVLAAGPYDLVVVLVPRTDTLRELRRRLPTGLRPFVLRPRPRRRCGSLDAAWVEYERNGCSLLGREELCGACPIRQRCPWPDRYTRLRGARLVLATQAQLKVNPHLVYQLAALAGAQRPLVLFDESDFLLRSSEQVIARKGLNNFREALRAVIESPGKDSSRSRSRAWLDMTDLVSSAATADLREGDWAFPAVTPRWAADVQRAGRQLHGPGFRFPAFDLHALARSDRTGRERLPDGGLRFATPFALGREFVVFSGSIARELARYRLDPNHARASLLSPFQELRFEHPETRWLNIASLAGSVRYFPRHAAAVLDFFAALIARNITAGRRTLLVARKRLLMTCAAYLTRRLDEMNAGPVRVVTGNWARHDLADPRTLPLISYGVCGLNAFEDFECAYCLTGYYVHPTAVAQILHDIEGSEERYPVTLGWSGQPPLRRATVRLPDGRETNLPLLAQLALEQKEADVVVQAVGRVRPFTRPREVITFQRGSLPGVRYHREFGSLAQARAYFGVPTPHQSRAQALAAEVQLRKALGQTNERIASELGVSVSTVKRYARRGGGSKGI